MFNSFEREHGSALAGRGVFGKHLLIVISYCWEISVPRLTVGTSGATVITR